MTETVAKEIKQLGTQGRFDDHIPAYETAVIRGTLMEFLSWKSPKGGSIDLVNYYCHKGVLMISGDLYDATHYFHPTYGLRDIAKCDLYYYMSKLRGGTSGNDGKEWSEPTATRWLDRFFEEGELNEKFGLEANARACDDKSLSEDCTNNEFAAVEKKHKMAIRKEFLDGLLTNP